MEGGESCASIQQLGEVPDLHKASKHDLSSDLCHLIAKKPPTVRSNGQPLLRPRLEQI